MRNAATYLVSATKSLEEAIDLSSNVIKHDESQYLTYLFKAYKEEIKSKIPDKSDLQEQASLLNLYLNVVKSRAFGYKNLAEVRIRQGDFEQAYEYFRKALSLAENLETSRQSDPLLKDEADQFIVGTLIRNLKSEIDKLSTSEQRKLLSTRHAVNELFKSFKSSQAENSPVMAKSRLEKIIEITGEFKVSDRKSPGALQKFISEYKESNELDNLKLEIIMQRVTALYEFGQIYQSENHIDNAIKYFQGAISVLRNILTIMKGTNIKSTQDFIDDIMVNLKQLTEVQLRAERLDLQAIPHEDEPTVSTKVGENIDYQLRAFRSHIESLEQPSQVRNRFGQIFLSIYMNINQQPDKLKYLDEKMEHMQKILGDQKIAWTEYDRRAIEKAWNILTNLRNTCVQDITPELPKLILPGVVVDGEPPPPSNRGESNVRSPSQPSVDENADPNIKVKKSIQKRRRRLERLFPGKAEKSSETYIELKQQLDALQSTIDAGDKINKKREKLDKFDLDLEKAKQSLIQPGVTPSLSGGQTHVPVSGSRQRTPLDSLSLYHSHSGTDASDSQKKDEPEETLTRSRKLKKRLSGLLSEAARHLVADLCHQ